MSDPLAFCDDELERLDAASLLRRVRALDSPQDAEVELDGRRLILLASNNYFQRSLEVNPHFEAADAARQALLR